MCPFLDTWVFFNITLSAEGIFINFVSPIICKIHVKFFKHNFFTKNKEFNKFSCQKYHMKIYIQTSLFYLGSVLENFQQNIRAVEGIYEKIYL